jgi:hypothetical protein
MPLLGGMPLCATIATGRAVSPGDATCVRSAAFGSVIVRSESQGGKHQIGFTQHVSSVLGRNGRGAANPAP